METTHIQIPDIFLEWSVWLNWNQLILTDQNRIRRNSIPKKPGVYEVRINKDNERLTIGKSNNLLRRIVSALIDGQIPHSAGIKIREFEDLSQIYVRWSETDRPACVEEELHKKYKAEHGVFPKYTQRT